MNEQEKMRIVETMFTGVDLFIARKVRKIGNQLAAEPPYVSMFEDGSVGVNAVCWWGGRSTSTKKRDDGRIERTDGLWHHDREVGVSGAGP